MADSHVTYYFILLEKKKIGGLRIWRAETFCRLSSLFILPEYQNQGYAQNAVFLAEQQYPENFVWQLDTIKEEKKLCHLYEKLGYCRTGEETGIQSGLTLVEYEKTIKE